NPVTQKYYFKSDYEIIFDWAIEIGFLPGVTDNVAHTVKQIAEDLLKIKFKARENVYSSQLTLIKGKLDEKKVTRIANSLYNPLIQRVAIKNHQQFVKDQGMDRIVPKVSLTKQPKVNEVDLEVNDEELVRIGKTGIANPDGSRRGPLALDLRFMKTIKNHFGKQKRNPTDVELESLAQTWSEHCKHTIFNDPIDEIKEGLFAKYIKGATEKIRKKKGRRDFCVSVFKDNSGAIIFDDKYLITHKVETHNSPSALDPYGGAVTGIVGVNRDAIGFGLGAKPVANFYGYCLADPRVNKPLYKGKNFTQPMLSSSRIMSGVIDGVNAGGNQSGIPTPQGFLYFDERYRGKPLVYVGTIGLIPRMIKGKQSHIKKAMPGDYVVMVGGRVGKDGIHGATFSSEAMDSGSPVGAVQIGDAITQKKLSDALVKEARDQLLYRSITDNGAGGLSCSVAEMAKESGGCLVNLEKVPLKYDGMEPWEIWVSESQERMTLAVPKTNWKKLKKLLDSREVEATVIGEFTGSGRCIVKYGKKTIMDIDMKFLHDGLPQRPMQTIPVGPAKQNFGTRTKIRSNKDLTSALSGLNICSYSFISQQYDYVVQANNALAPLQGKGRISADASAIKPVLTSKKGVVLSQGLWPEYGETDPYYMAAVSIDTAIRNAVASGADPDRLAILDNFCWCSPDDPERLGQLKEAARACHDYAVIYGAPFISGKDSMFNDFKGYDGKGHPIKISIPPTLLISSIGVVDDVDRLVSLEAKNPGDMVYLLGKNQIGKVDGVANDKLYHSFYLAVQSDLIASSISVNRGGLAVALAKKTMGGMLGAEIDLQEDILSLESAGRILVTVRPDNEKKFEKIMRGNVFTKIGQITASKKLIVHILKKYPINVSVDEMLQAYRRTFKNF
ncbi:AIR synthase-related protein, partial [Patescibacteria group bacterium]|nr:AIR synthase-related protein [Patescibacteria group bacterium]